MALAIKAYTSHKLTCQLVFLIPLQPSEIGRPDRRPAFKIPEEFRGTDAAAGYPGCNRQRISAPVEAL
jgi:hypothetical protein